MESWVLDGDSYSFLRSAPHTFNLQHLDGPNRVEIFDITRIPSHRGAISETTCLCDIFGDDCESPSLSSSPASTSFLRKDVDEQPVEDVNDSSGSYHTANGSEHPSDGSDTYEDAHDIKRLALSENMESNTPVSDLTSLNDKGEVTSENGSLSQTGYGQECCSSQDTSLKPHVKNSSDQQLVTSTSVFRDTNIRVTGFTQEIICPELLSENKAISDQSHATSSELRDTDSAEEIVSLDFRCISKQKVGSSSEPKENNSTQKIITSDSLLENSGITERSPNTTYEGKEADSKQENRHYQPNESTDSTGPFNNLAGESFPKENNNQGFSDEEISLPDVLQTGNISDICPTVESDSSVAPTNCVNECIAVTPFQKPDSDPSDTKGETEIREMLAPPEREVVPNKSPYTERRSDSEAPMSTVPPPTHVEDNTEIDVASVPHQCTTSSETNETIILHENVTWSMFSDTTEGYVMSKLYSSSGSIEDLNSSEPPIIIHSPVGFTLCTSPELKNNVWSSGTEDVEDLDSDSTFDSKLCLTPEPGSATSTLEVPKQNVFICESSLTASSNELSSASGSPEIHTLTCSSENQHSASLQILAPQNDLLYQNEDLAPTQDVEEINQSLTSARHADKGIHSVSSAHESISSPSSISPRDTVFPELQGMRCTESPTSNTLSAKEDSNMAISSTVLLSDMCIICPHSTVRIPSSTESADVHEIKYEDNSISTIPPVNERKIMDNLPDHNLSSINGCISSSPSTLCSMETESSVVMEAKVTEIAVLTTLSSKDIGKMASSPILQPLSAEGHISRPPSTLAAPRNTASPDVDGVRCVESPASSTVLTNELFMAISPISIHSPTPSILSVTEDTLFPDEEETKYAQRSMSNIPPIKEIENVVITQMTQHSSTESTEGGISISPPINTTSPDALGTKCVECSMNKTTNMAISPISDIFSSLSEECLSGQSSTLNPPRNASSPDIDGIKCEGIPLATAVHKNEMTHVSNSRNDLSLTKCTSEQTLDLSIPKETLRLDVDEPKYTERSNNILINETTNVAISPISRNSLTEEGIYHLPPPSASTGLDGLRCVENPISTILTKNDPLNLSISPVFEISSTIERISRPTSCVATPRDSESPAKGSKSTISPTDNAISPVCNISSEDKGILDISIPRDTMYPYVAEIYTERSNMNSDIAVSISNPTALSNMPIDSVITSSSPKMTNRRSPNRFNDHIPAPEMCIPLGSTTNPLSANVREKVALPLTIPVDAGQRDDAGNKMSLKSGIVPQDDCTDITSVPCCQTNQIIDSSPEPPAPKLSVKQIKENWEKMNETILNSLNPWETSKKILSTPTPREAREGNDSARESLEGESADNEKTFGQMSMRPGESPSILHSTSASVLEGQSCRNKGRSVERVIQEEDTLGKGVGKIAEGRYRGKQVELSVSTRNRKGPASRSPAPSSRDPKSGIPPRYFESPLATRRQQSRLSAQNIQKDNKTSARRVRSTSQSKYSGAGCLSSDCTSETSSMGSEFDDADNEVKWFTDQAFSSLSNPQVDYLDVYNSSHGSSTNVSQHSTVDSPGSATWISYADLHGLLHKNDDLLCDPSLLPHATLDPAKKFEMTSFECVDVAMENKEETIKGKRTVPKRQIQFKRHNFDEPRSSRNEGKERKEIDLLSPQICLRDTVVRQHSTPASMQDDLVQGEHETQTGKMLQKSASLDESLNKGKMASSVIKSVLSKKIDTATKQFISTEPCENKKKHNETISTWESSETPRQSLSLPLPECTLFSEDFSGKEEKSFCPQKKSCGPKVPPKPVFRANCFPPNSNSATVAFQGKSLVKNKISPIMINACESKISKNQIIDNIEKEANKLGDQTRSDPGRSIDQTPHCTASTEKGMTNSDSNYPMIPETYKQLEGSSSMFLSKTHEINLMPCTIKDKNISSLKSFCPEVKISKDTMCDSRLELEETHEEQTSFKSRVEADTEEDIEQNKEKSVIHKVRDVRKLVKNTYNLSFKAPNTPPHVDKVVPEKQEEMQTENPHHLHIECKAISRKDKQASCNKSTNQQDVTNTADTLNKTDPVIQIDQVEIRKTPAKAFLPHVQHSDVDSFAGLDQCNSKTKSDQCEVTTKLEMPLRPPSKEISTLVFLQDDTAKSIQNPPSPTSLGGKTATSSHSVSMLRKEKGMQADIGVCDVMSKGPGAKPKHINRLEIPLQTYASDEPSSESEKVKQEDADFPPEQKTSINSSESTMQVRSSPKPKEVREQPSKTAEDNQSQRDLFKTQKEQGIAIASSSKAEVRAFSSSTKIQAMPVATSKEIELPIQVRSISSERSKPAVLPKLSYKQPFAEIRSTSKDIPKSDITPTTSILKEQTPLKSEFKIFGTSATLTNNEQAIKTLAVSAVSSHKPQTIPFTTMASSAQKLPATRGRQEVSIISEQNTSNLQQNNIQEHVMPSAPYASKYQSLPELQANSCIQPTMITSSNNRLHTGDFHFPSSDDPPSYDERESFSPLQLSNLSSRRQNRYHPLTKHSLCSCISCTQPRFGQPFHGSQSQTPPAPRSPGQVISYPGAPPQAQVRPHQSIPDGQPSNYPPVSLKTTIQQAPTMIQPMHHSHTCPAPTIQPYGIEQQQTSTQQMDRRSGNQRSPQAPSGTTYRKHSHSPNVAVLDPRSQFFNAQELSPAFGHEYGSDGPSGGGVLYPENASGLGYNQGPRRVLLDTETGKYFYIEVPMQPLRKMLFDTEIGQYVEVLIPQQGMSNSNMYPPTAVPYQGSYQGQGLYASQYLPYAVPPHPQSAQQPRHPEPSVPTSLHQNTMGYGSSACQMPKSDVKGHPSLDQSYLEGMYYIPTRMNASPNSTSSDFYHKPPTNMPAVGGRRA